MLLENTKRGYLYMKYPIKEEWNNYYETLEVIRKSGITNMFGSAPYLAEYCNIDLELAKDILCSWIDNYDELNKKLSWR